MIVLYLANAVVVLVACWALWVRRDAFGSRWDGPITAGIAFYAVAVLLDSPWPAISAASFPATGKYYLIPALGQICYVIGSAVGLRSAFIRLLPDEEIGPFMRTRIAPPVVVAVTIMVVCVVASPATSTMSAGYLYQVAPDGWLTAYFTTFLLSLAAMMVVTQWCLARLRDDPQTTLVQPLRASTAIGAVGCLTFLTAILTRRAEFVPIVAWPIVYIATTVASIGCALSWRRRVAALRGGHDPKMKPRTGFCERPVRGSDFGD